MLGSAIGQGDAPFNVKAAMACAAAALTPQEQDDFLFATADRLDFGRPPETPGTGDAP